MHLDIANNGEKGLQGSGMFLFLITVIVYELLLVSFSINDLGKR